jgi:glutathione S-transferase
VGEPLLAPIQLWGAHTARTMRVVWTAEELGLDYMLHSIGPRTGETHTSTYTALNPKQKIPCLTDASVTGGLVLTESLAIARYLISAYPSEALKPPSTPAESAVEDEWCAFALSELDETSLYVVRRHRDLAHIYGESRVVVEACFEYLDRQLRVVEAHLSRRVYVLDGGFSLADIMLTTCLTWAIDYGAELGVAALEYVQRMKKREAYLRAIKINYPRKPTELLGEA